jgi:Zn-dependent membrane protease YugP
MLPRAARLLHPARSAKEWDLRFSSDKEHPMFFLMSPLLLLLSLPAMIIAFAAQSMLQSRLARYGGIANGAGLSGREVAQAILYAEGIEGVEIERVDGLLTDHYSPRERVLRLSSGVHDGRSVAALGVAAHEVGHAIQHARGYAPLALRSTIAPAAAFGSAIGVWLVPIFIAVGALGLAQVGLAIFAVSTLFTLVTLPVELDASRRALVEIEALGLARGADAEGARSVLTAAGLTYVAAAASSIAYLLYFVLEILAAQGCRGPKMGGAG